MVSVYALYIHTYIHTHACIHTYTQVVRGYALYADCCLRHANTLIREEKSANLQWIYICIYKHTHPCMCTYTRIFSSEKKSLLICSEFMCVCVYIYIYIYIYIYAHTHSRTYVCVCVCTYTQKCSHWSRKVCECEVSSHIQIHIQVPSFTQRPRNGPYKIKYNSANRDNTAN